VAALRDVTAAFCETDRVAAVVHQACVREGIRVPHDLSIVGYDNSDLARCLDLTSVEQHFDEIGRQAVQLLLDDLDGKLAGPTHRSVDSELIIRGSTARRSVEQGSRQ
jgi:LacI family repressor for deo operon, udp, cdd, tsx, nupC, and nupG